MRKRRLHRRFPAGQQVATPNAMEAIPLCDILTALVRHFRCDWGDADDEDWESNNLALDEGTRLFSVYHSSNGVKFWIITEADRSATTVLLPEDY
jgi:hypothetical protein